jgi:purine-cytosine permease-like protein
MDIGIIGGLAFALALNEGCKPQCELNIQTLFLASLIVLIAALGTRYIKKHSSNDAADQAKNPESGD